MTYQNTNLMSIWIIFALGPVPIAVPQPEPHSVGGVLVHMPHVCSVCIEIVRSKSLLNSNCLKEKLILNKKKSMDTVYEKN